MDPADQEEFEATCLPLLGDLRAFALSLTRRLHDAEDLVQETAVRAWRNWHRFTPGTNAKAWLFTILRRLHIDRYRRARVRPTTLPEDELVEMSGEEARARQDELTTELPWDDIPTEVLHRLVEEVPDAFRPAVRLRDLDGFSYREIGEILDIPPGTVMSRLHRGRESLRKLLVAHVESARRPRLEGDTPDPHG